MEFFFLKYYFGHATFLYMLRRSSGHHQSFLKFQIFQQNVSKPTKSSKKDRTFYNTVSPKKRHSFYESWHLATEKKALATLIRTFLALQIFLVNMLLFCFRKDICTKGFVDAKNCTLETLWKQMSVCFIFLYISVRKFLLQTRSKVLYGGMEFGGELNNLLKAPRCLGLTKCLTILQNLWKLNYFSAFRCCCI